MDKYVYNALSKYFNALENAGFMSNSDVCKLLILVFFHKLICGNYRMYLTRKDYHTISKALNCLYGYSCLLPYPDYAKMENMKLEGINSNVSETRALEIYEQELNQRILENVRAIAENSSRIDAHDEQIASIENTRVIKGNSYVQDIPDIDLDRLDQGE